MFRSFQIQDILASFAQWYSFIGEIFLPTRLPCLVLSRPGIKSNPSRISVDHIKIFTTSMRSNLPAPLFDHLVVAPREIRARSTTGQQCRVVQRAASASPAHTPNALPCVSRCCAADPSRQGGGCGPVMKEKEVVRSIVRTVTLGAVSGMSTAKWYQKKSRVYQ